MATTVNGLEQIAGRTVPEFDGLFDIWPRGDRLAQIRAAAEAFKLRFKKQGTVQAVPPVDLATAPYVRQHVQDPGLTARLLPDLSLPVEFDAAQSLQRWDPMEWVSTVARWLNGNGERGRALFDGGVERGAGVPTVSARGHPEGELR